MEQRFGRRRFLRGAALVGAAGAAGIIPAASAAVEPAEPSAERLTFDVPDLDPAHDGLRVAQLSDLHVGPRTPAATVRAAIEQANAFAPDLVVLTGDYLSHSRSELQAMRDQLGGLVAPTVAVLGNHDVWVDPAGATAVLRGHGYEVLENGWTSCASAAPRCGSWAWATATPTGRTSAGRRGGCRRAQPRWCWRTAPHRGRAPVAGAPAPVPLRSHARRADQRPHPHAAAPRGAGPGAVRPRPLPARPRSAVREPRRRHVRHPGAHQRAARGDARDAAAGGAGVAPRPTPHLACASGACLTYPPPRGAAHVTRRSHAQPHRAAPPRRGAWRACGTARRAGRAPRSRSGSRSRGRCCAGSTAPPSAPCRPPAPPRGSPPSSPLAGEEWVSGPYLSARFLRLLPTRSPCWRATETRPSARLGETEDGRLTVRVFPAGPIDALLFPGVRGEVHLREGVARRRSTRRARASTRRPPTTAASASCSGRATSTPSRRWTWRPSSSRRARSASSS